MDQEQNHKPASHKPVAAFVISLIAGLWMLLMGGVMGWGYMGGGGGHMHGSAGGYGWMWQHHQMMHGYGGGFLWFWLGSVAAIIVLIGAVALYSKPSSAPGWGVVILVSSCVALLSGTGGFIAGVLGMIGGVLAMAWKPQGP